MNDRKQVKNDASEDRRPKTDDQRSTIGARLTMTDIRCHGLLEHRPTSLVIAMKNDMFNDAHLVNKKRTMRLAGWVVCPPTGLKVNEHTLSTDPC
jgi:hypothetical protein